MSGFDNRLMNGCVFRLMSGFDNRRKNGFNNRLMNGCVFQLMINFELQHKRDFELQRMSGFDCRYVRYKSIVLTFEVLGYHFPYTYVSAFYY